MSVDLMFIKTLEMFYSNRKYSHVTFDQNAWKFERMLEHKTFVYGKN